MDARQTTCADCGAAIDEDPRPEERMPCPACGSTRRRIHVTVSDSFSAYDSMRAQKKDPARKSKDKLRVDSFTGYEKSHALGRMVKKDRLIDRDNDRYYEHIVDPENNETLHLREEKLSEHIGHGYAKKKP